MMRFSQLVPFMSAVAALLFLAGCRGDPSFSDADVVHVGERPKGERVATSMPSRASLEAMGLSIQALRRAISNQETRLEEARKTLQKLTDDLQKNKEVQKSGQAKFRDMEKMIEELKARLDAVENELATIRSRKPAVGSVAAPAPPLGPVGAAAPSSKVTPIGIPQAKAGARAGVAPAGSPAEGVSPAGVSDGTSSVSVLAPPSGEPAPKAAVPSSPGRDAEKEFEDALRVFREERNFTRARLLLRKFIEAHPNHDSADDAQYWIGESYFLERNYERAILAFNKVQVDFANGDRASDALLKEALSFKNLGDKASARELLERVIKKYPESAAAEAARTHLKSF